MKQTAVEWLHSEYKRILGDVLVKPSQGIEIADALEQAKEMEKQQLRIAWDSSEQNMRSTFSSSQYKGIKFEEWLKKIRL